MSAQEAGRTPNWTELCDGIVEQTTNGIRVGQDWERKARAGGKLLPFPIVNVAETALKLRDESPLIGRAIVFNLKHILRSYEHWDLPGKNALVVGYGSVGAEVAKALRSEGANVVVFDFKRDRKKAAHGKFKVART